MSARDERNAASPSGSGTLRKTIATRAGEPVRLDTVDASDRARVKTGIAEFDRVTGGGLVTGSLILLAGEPGIGKSTLLAQVTAALVGLGEPSLYISGEESAGQIRLRAERLGLDLGSLEVLAENDATVAAATIEARRPRFAVIDSVQTLGISDSNGSPGSPAQVREVTGLFLRTAKRTGTTMLLVGHVNKDAAVAGPKTLEHLVDAVLLLEGDRNGYFRVLRAQKRASSGSTPLRRFAILGAACRSVAHSPRCLRGPVHSSSRSKHSSARPPITPAVGSPSGSLRSVWRCCSL